MYLLHGVVEAVFLALDLEHLCECALAELGDELEVPEGGYCLAHNRNGILIIVPFRQLQIILQQSYILGLERRESGTLRVEQDEL